MSDSSELDKIIKGGKSNPSIAMVVFAIELKTMQSDLADVKSIVQGDERKYVMKEDYLEVKARVTNLEKKLFNALVFVTIIVASAVIGTVIKGVQ